MFVCMCVWTDRYRSRYHHNSDTHTCSKLIHPIPIEIQAPATGSSIPTIFTPAVHTRLGQMKARHAAVERELNELHASGIGGSSNPQRLAQLSKELAELREVVDMAGQLEGKRSEVGMYVCVYMYVSMCTARDAESQ